MSDTTFNMRECPFCKTELINSTVHCPEYKYYSCLECTKCHSYFFTKSTYKKLYELAEKKNRKLNSRVFYYDAETSIWKHNTTSKSFNKNKVSKSVNKKTKRNKKSKTNKKMQINQSTYNKILARIKFKHARDCVYFSNIYCLLLKSECDPSSTKCDFKNTFDDKHNIKEKDYKNNTGVTALVISDNRKCTYNTHELQDVLLIIRIVSKNGNITDSHILASYCKTCDEYFILKSDYYELKTQGAILCPIEDRTIKQKSTQKYANAGSESRIHQLGYNVKKGSKLTTKQRQIILANIVENTGITKAEIKSNIIRCINQHKKHKGYENAIICWQNDLEFINNYCSGDIPEIRVDKLILKYKQDS